MTGFGMDGNVDDKKNDFEQVRGDFDSNPFVMDVVVHIKHKTARADELIDMLNKMN